MLAVESVAKISELPIQRNSGVSRRTLTMFSSVGWCGMTVGGHASSSGGVLNALLIELGHESRLRATSRHQCGVVTRWPEAARNW
ncbi:hypothetical protein ABIF90_008512 [Bradyrhizobium japonicum]